MSDTPLGLGEVVGEMGPLEGLGRSADVVTLEGVMNFG